VIHILRAKIILKLTAHECLVAKPILETGNCRKCFDLIGTYFEIHCSLYTSLAVGKNRLGEKDEKQI